MGDSDDSSTKSSSKSSKKSRRSLEQSESKGTSDNNDEKTTRKKKTRRRPSGASNAASNTDTSDAEAARSSKKIGRKKSSRQKASTAGGGSNAPMKDSMLVAIKKKRKAISNGNGGVGGRNFNRDVSFSGSTVKRDIGKKSSELDMAMGKMPQPISTSKKGGGALRPSKYGDNKKKTSFAEEDEPPATTTSDGPRKSKPTFKTVDYGSEDDSDVGRRAPRRSTSMSSLNGSSQQPGRRPQSMNSEGGGGGQLGRQPSWQPDRIGPSISQKTRSRRNTTGNDSSVDELKSSLTAQRPGIQRRNSMGSITTNQRISHDLLLGGNDDEGPKRSNMLRAAQSVAQLNQHKHIRRLKMSVEHQTFIPPKSRQTSVFQAMTHLMAGRLVDLTLWTYQASFLKVMLFFLVFYTVNIFIWAAVLDGVDLASGGRCIHEDPESLSRSDRYEFVFELAWATFTTVGYGTISPQGDMTGCYPIRFTCAFVAFIGVLFGSQTAAIMYSKLMRLLAKAHVTFSSTLCVQYGKGNEGSTVRFGQLNFRASVAPSLLKKFSASDLLDDSSETEGDSPSDSEGGFPVIEFRMINDRANHEGSEIWDAQIRGIVQLHKEQPSENNFTNNFVKEKATGGESTLDLEKKVYYPILLSPDTHPHFSRIWYARHTLNAESPLLKRDIRDMIVKDGGKWDKDFNNWEEIRDCLNEFISLRITLSGTSAVSASTVYGEHVYGFDDVCVGWRFANMVYEKKERVYKSWWRTFGCGRALMEDEMENHDTTDDMRTKIDAALLHDIIPQPGGDHEPLNETNKATLEPGSFFTNFFTFGFGDG